MIILRLCHIAINLLQNVALGWQRQSLTRMRPPFEVFANPTMNPRLPRTGKISFSNFFPHGKWILLINSFLRKLGPSWKWEGWCYLQTPWGLTANCSFKGAGLERPFHRPNWPMGGRLEWGEDFDQSQATIVATSMTRVPRSGWWRDRLWPRLHWLTLAPVIRG